jgi:hypothetical protein
VTLPADASSLLVPIQLDAWVVTSQNQQPLAYYFADYTRLRNFQSPIPDPFDVSTAARPATGVHLHWALPDALTHGRQSSATSSVTFPLVPNRWVVVRFGPTDTSRACTMWVIQSDYTGAGATSGTSAFLDPNQATYMDVDVGTGSTTIELKTAGLGRNHTITEWQAMGEPGGPLFLQAVGPGNVTFAAYEPFVRDVFSFVDSSLPAEGTGLYHYTYLVVGYYSDPSAGDPLRGVNVYDPSIWPDQNVWSGETSAQRFQDILAAMEWSTSSVPSTPPMTSLYHGLVSQVQWPYNSDQVQNPPQVEVTVGNSSISALAAVVQSRAQAMNLPTAGPELAELIEAAMLDMLEDYGKPGGSTLVQERIRDAWFGSAPGGTVWTVVSVTPRTSTDSAKPPQLTAAQTAALDAQLGALNASQYELDRRRRVLLSQQFRLYLTWWKLAQATSYGWGMAPQTTPPLLNLVAFLQQELAPGGATLFQQTWTEYCWVATQQGQLPSPTDRTAANAWADTNWRFADANGTPITLAGLGLELKAGTAPPFSHANDPVLLFGEAGRSQKYGEGGRFTDDGTLRCRVPGEVITGIAIPGQPAINGQTVQSILNTCPSYSGIASIPSLLDEALLVDPGSGPLIAETVNGSAATIGAAIAALVQGTQTTATWIGTPPLPFAVQVWQQPWIPILLEWELRFYPTGAGGGPERRFALSDWVFDGSQYTWAGTGFDPNYFIPYEGRTILTPQAPLVFQSKIARYLKNHPDADSPQLEQLIASVGSWDLLSQSLSGFTMQLETLLTQQAFPPTPVNDPTVPCPPGSTPPSITALVGDEYHAVPMLQGTGLPVNYFNPVRAGLVVLDTLQIVDSFGQTLQAAVPNTGQGFQPLLAAGLAPTNVPANLPYGAFQLPPRLVQGARLEITFLANDGSGQDVTASSNPNAICGWVLPNHLDGALAFYDGNGVLQGELISVPAPANWRPRPGDPGATPPPASPADIPNVALRQVVQSIAAQSAEVFEDVLETIDETLWMLDPLGGRKDQFLSVLIGRPLAIVQARLELSLNGLASVNQLWNSTVTPQTAGPPSSYQWANDDGGLETLKFPVRLGSLDLRDDGLIGYYLPDAEQPCGTLYAVHVPGDLSAGDAYIKPILNQSGSVPAYQGDIQLTPQPDSASGGGRSVLVTLLLDPRGTVHAYTGILPTATGALPASAVEDFVRDLKVTFRAGPILAAPGTLRTPKPAEAHGVWQWIQRSAPGTWESDQIVDATDQALLPEGSLTIRDGWLQLSDADSE